MTLHPPRDEVAGDALEHLRELLGGFAYRFAHENELQAGLEQVLRGAGTAFEREVRLGESDVIDFLVEPGIGVEVKVGGSLAAVTRQLHRYAQREAVRALLLISTLHRLDHQPERLNGKPVAVLVLSGGLA